MPRRAQRCRWPGGGTRGRSLGVEGIAGPLGRYERDPADGGLSRLHRRHCRQGRARLFVCVRHVVEAVGVLPLTIVSNVEATFEWPEATKRRIPEAAAWRIASAGPGSPTRAGASGLLLVVATNSASPRAGSNPHSCSGECRRPARLRGCLRRQPAVRARAALLLHHGVELAPGPSSSAADWSSAPLCAIRAEQVWALNRQESRRE